MNLFSLRDEFMFYKVEIKEILSKIIDIEADNEEGSIKEARKQYINENIILNAEDYIDTEFKIYK